MNRHNYKMASVLFAALLSIGLSTGVMGCKEKGPVEKVGEEIDEAVDTAKNGGKESTANKVDDAVDDLRDGVKKAGDDIKGK